MRKAAMILQGISFQEEVVMIQYLDPTDIKANGAQKHVQLYVPRDDDYDDEIAALEDAARFLIGDIGEDWSNLKSADDMKKQFRKTEDDEEDD